MEEDDIDDFLITDAGCCSRFYHSILQCCAKSRRFLFPFEKDVDFIEVRFGKAIGVYFQFFRVMVLAAVYMSIAIFVTHIFHFIALVRFCFLFSCLFVCKSVSGLGQRERKI